MKTRFRNRVVVVTGAAAGIGRQLCLRFAQAGAWIVMLDLKQEPLDALGNQLMVKHNTKALGLVCDISDPDAVAQAFDRILDQFGGIDLLINNAGIVHRSAFVDTELEVFRRVMEVNYFGSLYCTKSALPSLLERKGMIIAMSSMSGFAPLWHRSGYSASKHALHGLFDCLRVELAESGVQVMMVCPGFTATDIRKNALRADGSIRGEPFPWIGDVASAVDVAEDVFQGALKGKRLLVLSNVGRGSRLLYRFFPQLFERLVSARLSGVGDQKS
ncbi:SDR family oxidoreductase [Aestuariirhabdus litorea]|uniref:SDR family oxidoreductase n=1 Tax=Aestuariirhabdus litorea TaxID=2528527 RepID=A0A3P3VLG6_9GAMM|nr:SDR family oxidoreductase [Aestuariirhabdus litorea]RRJ83177.1 SDR family oxidoreductase [Aestuariirhabdus litorea]RWW93334.1 SDR family oxidoreductase [Endozoicomonadaceae bacterium GTF-13]